MPSPQLAKPLRAVRRRLRLQAALDGAATIAVPAAAGEVIAVYLWRAGLLSHHHLAVALASGVGLVLAGGLARALERIPLARAAKRADGSHGLHDRLGSALAFEREAEPTPFMQAAILDGKAAAGTIDPRRAAPFARPRATGLALGIAALAMVVAMLHFPARARRVAAPPPPPRHLTVDADLLGVERDQVEALAAEARASGDRQTEEAAQKLETLLDQVNQRQLTRQQVFDKLAEIEKKLPAPDADSKPLTDALKRAGDELGKREISRAAGEALKKEDLEKARAELQKLAARAEKLDAQKRKDGDKPLDTQERKELARALDAAAKAETARSAEAEREQAERDRLEREQRRLQRELAERPNDQQLKRQLQRNQRELQRLERQKQARAEQERQLQRLQRELERAAAELQKSLSPEAAEALRQAARQMKQMQDELRKLGNLQKTQIQIAELKEVLRRARSTSGQGQPQNGQAQNGRNGQGQKGQKGAKSLLRDFNQRAGGKSDSLLLGEGGNTPVLLPLPGGPGDQPGQEGKGGGAPPQPSASGDGIGHEHDPNLLGDPTRLAAHHQETRLTGKEGAGPSRSETILGSAERGFATRSYRRVYDDYSSVVEEVMSKERVPPGYRYYIKRYFQLIRPRQ
ncbi:MAG TPA: hypothetical protein VII38_22165 [Polyangia bacterium]